MSLENEIEDKSQEISTDAYAMSIGELVSLYKENELDIHPEFQRFFRWTISQKSRFIESLLLGIPIPSIFVSQTNKGKWDVVDGLQRISTILQLMGILKDKDDKLVKRLKLEKTKYLPSLDKCVWDNPIDDEIELPELAKLKIKRSRLDIKIVLNTSDVKSKYELFQRLNTGGTIATHQEVRNCILLMINKEFYDWVDVLRNNEHFKQCIPLSERQYDEQYDMELVIRFIVLRTLDSSEIRKSNELGVLLTDKIVEFAEDTSFDKTEINNSFENTFKILANTLGEDSFRKYNNNKNIFSGPFSISMFEILALGIGYNCLSDGYSITKDDIINIIKKLWDDPSFISNTGSGIRFTTRLPITLQLGRDSFKK
jgi:hypothetical protein